MKALPAALLLALLAGGAAPAAEPADVVAGPESRLGLELTLFGNGRALVVDRRRIDWPDDATHLVLTGLPARMIADSAFLREVAVKEQSFSAPTPQALLEQSVGQPVAVVRTDPATGRDIAEEGRLLSAGAGPVVAFDGLIQTQLPGRLAFYHLPPGMQPTPSLRLQPAEMKAGKRDITATYLTEGLNWTADYVAILASGGTRLDLEGRASLVNHSGGAYADAAITLVAGEINRAPPAGVPRAMTTAAPASLLPREETAGDTHVYSLEGRQSLAEGEVRQVPLVAFKDVAVSTEYRLEDPSGPLMGPAEGAQPLPVGLRLTLPNRLGKPLPAGTLRVYQGGRLVGEDRIGATAAGETAVLTLARAFDLNASRRQTAFERVSATPPVYESAHEIEIRNAKAEAAVVVISEPMPGDWSIVSENVAHDRGVADHAVWRIEVPAHGKAVVAYRVRVRP